MLCMAAARPTGRQSAQALPDSPFRSARWYPARSRALKNAGPVIAQLARSPWVECACALRRVVPMIMGSTSLEYRLKPGCYHIASG
jgi:hypothetical protein